MMVLLLLSLLLPLLWGAGTHDGGTRDGVYVLRVHLNLVDLGNWGKACCA